ncbi:hypothetical protein H9P43_001191 [Blastocladiella emersonii ATCC 22665]|nr:hypothetical protein H9P43_001191 [Blastocladiella emersonii ATCC 22665]
MSSTPPRLPAKVPDLVASLVPLLDHLGHLFEEVNVSQTTLESELERVVAEVQLLESLIEASPVPRPTGTSGSPAKGTPEWNEVSRLIAGRLARVRARMADTTQILDRVATKVTTVTAAKEAAVASRTPPN